MRNRSLYPPIYAEIAAQATHEITFDCEGEIVRGVGYPQFMGGQGATVYCRVRDFPPILAEKLKGSTSGEEYLIFGVKPEHIREITEIDRRSFKIKSR